VELAHRLQRRGVRQLVVTRGSRGALVVTADGATHHVPGVEVSVVDTTGAGDAFTCALGVALAQGGRANEPAGLLEAARFATYAGALAVTRLGVIPALPTRAEVEALRGR
jgi:ribokinase